MGHQEKDAATFVHLKRTEKQELRALLVENLYVGNICLCRAKTVPFDITVCVYGVYMCIKSCVIIIYNCCFIDLIGSYASL